MFRLEYRDNGKRVVLTLTEKDLREWLYQWPDYVGPDAITLRKVRYQASDHYKELKIKNERRRPVDQAIQR